MILLLFRKTIILSETQKMIKYQFSFFFKFQAKYYWNNNKNNPYKFNNIQKNSRFHHI